MTMILIAGLETFTSIVQQLTNSNFGNIKAYIGQEEKNQLGIDLESAFSRIQGTLGNPNIVGAWLICVSPFLLIMSYYDKFNTNSYWLLKVVLFIGVCLTIFFTFSRGSNGIFLLLLLSFTPFFLRIGSTINLPYIDYQKTIKKVSYFFIIIATCVFIIVKVDVILLALNYAESRINSSFEDAGKVASADFRLVMNQAAIKYIFQNPFIGIGFSNGELIYKEVGFFQSFLQFRPHNTYLLMGVEGGIFAMITFIIITLFPIYRLLMIRPSTPFKYALLFSLIACLGFVQIYLITVSSDFAPLYFSLMGIAMGYADICKVNHALK